MSVQRWQCWVWQHVSWLCLEVASHTSNFRADSLTCALGWVIWILWCLRHFEFQLWWCWWKLEEADRNKGNSKHKKMGAMSLWTHSQMGLGIGALGVPELRRIPSGQLEPPGLLLKRIVTKILPTGATRRLVPECVCKSNEVEWIIQKTISCMLKIENWENENEDVKKPFGGVQIRSERREMKER